MGDCIQVDKGNYIKPYYKPVVACFQVKVFSEGHNTGRRVESVGSLSPSIYISGVGLHCVTSGTFCALSFLVDS